MKTNHWLNLYGWPVAAVVVLFALFAWLVRLTGQQGIRQSPAARPARINYAMQSGKETLTAEEIAELRAIYASDLFASSRNIQFPAEPSSSRKPSLAAVPPTLVPFSMSSSPSSNIVADVFHPIMGRSVMTYETDAYAGHRTERLSGKAAKESPRLAIEGDLNGFRIDPAFFKDIALPAGPKPWSIAVDIKFDKAGYVEYVFAEPSDCERHFYDAIINRLYQYRLTNATQACQGKIIISYSSSIASSNKPALD